MRRVLLLLLAAALTCWLAGTLLTRPARQAAGVTPEGVEPVAFGQVKGWWWTGKPGCGAVILMHGVRGNRRDMLPRATWLANAGFHVLSFDFQAHGESNGDQITFGYRESRDARAAVAFVRQRLPQERLATIGASLGGAATILAEPPLAIDAALFELVYPDLHRAVANRIGRYLGAWARPFAYPLEWQLQPRLGIGVEALRPIDRIGALTMPKLLIAGELDRHTTLAESRELFAAAREPKELWIVPQAQHEDLHRKAGPEYERRVLAFLTKHLR